MLRSLVALVALFGLLPGAALGQSGEGLRQLEIAEAALADGDPLAAIRSCESALRLDPARWECVRVLGFAFEQVNDLEGAAIHLSAYQAHRARLGSDPDPDVAEMLELVGEGRALAVAAERGEVRVLSTVPAASVWPIWAAGVGGTAGVFWGRPADNPGVRVRFRGAAGAGSVSGGGGVSWRRMRLLGMGQLEIGATGPPEGLLVAFRVLAQLELVGPGRLGGWARLGGGVTPTSVREQGVSRVLGIGSVVLAGGLRVRTPQRTRLLLGAELELLPGLAGGRAGLRAELWFGPN